MNQLLRSQFPLLHRTVHNGVNLVYLDNAATTQKPQSVIEAIADYYTHRNSNVHRGAHAVAAEATEMFERARATIAAFINAQSVNEIVFTKGTTESINLVAASWGRLNLKQNDEILLTQMEHHANIVPWQLIAQQTGAKIVVVPVNDDGTFSVQSVAEHITSQTRIIACTHVSNTLGTVNPVAGICALAREHGITTLVDGAQAVQHFVVDVQELGCDFYAFSAHKLYGPTGFGVLYGRFAVLDTMPPYQGGGAMIETVSFRDTTFAAPPLRFEAGTPHIAGAIGTKAAIEWFMQLNADDLRVHEQSLTQALLDSVSSIPGVRLIGNAPERAGIVSFVVDGAHAHDVGILLDEQGIAVRTGHHCTMPLLQRYHVDSVVRVSIGVYNNLEDVERFGVALHKTIKMLT